MRALKMILKSIWAFPFFIFSMIVWPFFYDWKYLSAPQFSSLDQKGWFWVPRDVWSRLTTGKNLRVRWPISPACTSGCDIEFDPHDLSVFQSEGGYFQTMHGKIFIGHGTYIANGVALITTNHDPYCLSKHLPGKDITIGKDCWLGRNVTILPGVTLGDHTIVGAGAIVTHSFPEGYAVLAGNPAKKIKMLDKEKFEAQGE